MKEYSLDGLNWKVANPGEVIECFDPRIVQFRERFASKDAETPRYLVTAQQFACSQGTHESAEKKTWWEHRIGEPKDHWIARWCKHCACAYREFPNR